MSETKFLFNRKVEFTPSWGLALNLCIWPDEYPLGSPNTSLQIHFIYGNFFIKLPFSIKFKGEDMLNEYGFTYFHEGQQFHFHLNDITKIVDMPWAWTHVRHTIWGREGNDVSDKAKNLYGDELDEITKPQFYTYQYKLKRGEVQERIATIWVEEREWRWKCLKFLPFPRSISKSIQVEFNEEIGERCGSWKGGCIGTSYEMKQNESAYECLRRMEQERKFK